VLSSFNSFSSNIKDQGGIMLRKVLISVVIISLLLACMSCATMSRKQKGAVIGGTAGAVVGGVIGKAAGSTVVGAILGAAVGGAAGAYIGNYMDKQAAEMERDLEGAKVERVGEGIKITFDSGILFDVDSASLKPVSKDNLAKLAEILQKYKDTDILIEGHTDSTGTEEHNLTLSKQRAQSVSNYLAQLQVSPTRFTIMGYGESQPIAPNDTTEGRQQNRRVDLGIMANEKLKKVAKEQG
jgi:outer membrane protein OmpA-like peptidoglycan-associated protein